MSDLWVERYRPQTLDDLMVDDKTRQIIQNFGRDIPNLLLTGVAGSGKTSLAKIIAKDILNCDYLYILMPLMKTAWTRFERKLLGLPKQ